MSLVGDRADWSNSLHLCLAMAHCRTIELSAGLVRFCITKSGIKGPLGPLRFDAHKRSRHPLIGAMWSVYPWQKVDHHKLYSMTRILFYFQAQYKPEMAQNEDHNYSLIFYLNHQGTAGLDTVLFQDSYFTLDFLFLDVSQIKCVSSPQPTHVS